MTLRRKRSIFKAMSHLLVHEGQRKQRATKRKNVDADPSGRSYYYSTYRKKTFDPNHWKLKLSKYLLYIIYFSILSNPLIYFIYSLDWTDINLCRDTLDQIYKDKTCTTVIDMFGYSN